MLAQIILWYKNTPMEQDHFAQFEKDIEEHRQRVQKVGAISLSPDATRREYLLATVDKLNTHLGRSATREELDEALTDVVKYKLWDADNDGTYPGSVMRIGSVHMDVIFILGHLSENGWINQAGPIELTDAGREMLAQFTPAVVTTKA